MKNAVFFALVALVLLSGCVPTKYVEGPRTRTYKQWVRFYKKAQRHGRRYPIPVADERFERPRR